MPRSNINQTNIGKGFSLSPISAVEASRLPRNSLFLDKDNQLSFKSMAGTITTALNAAGQVPIPIGINVWNAASNQITSAPRNILKFTGTAIASITDNPGSGLVQVEINAPSGVELTTNKNQPDGYVGLNGSGKIDAAQLPSYVDDVEEYADLASFPVTGETDKLYVAINTSLTYRWSGSTYTLVGGDPGLFQLLSEKDQVGGYAGLDGAGKLAIGQLPNLGLGTASTHNVPASGNASASEVVKGDDTRLSDARTPLSHAITAHTGYPTNGYVAHDASNRMVFKTYPVGLAASTRFLYTDEQDNTFLGLFSGPATYGSISFGSTSLGKAAGANLTTGAYNTLVGASAGLGVSSAAQCVAIGAFTLFGNGSGVVVGGGQVAVGTEALYTANASAAQNTASGFQSLKGLTAGLRNTASGYQSGLGVLSGNDSVAVGYRALYGSGSAVITSSGHVAVGSEALAAANASAASLTAVGFQAGRVITNAYGNTLLGSEAGWSLTSGSENTLSGVGAGRLITTGGGNTFYGMNTGYNLSGTAGNNTAMGAYALYSTAVATPTLSTAIGAYSSYQSTNGLNSCLGAYSGYTGNTPSFTNNTLIGYKAGYSMSQGNNVAVGHLAGRGISSGSSNIAVGSFSLYGNDSAIVSSTGQIAIGYESLYSANTSSSSNTAIGYQSLKFSTTGIRNTAIGYQSAYSSISGLRNTMIGYQSGYNITSGENNTYIGDFVGSSTTLGSNNTYIGKDADESTSLDAGETAGLVTNSIAIGSGAKVSKSNKAQIGNSSVTQFQVGDQFKLTTTQIIPMQTSQTVDLGSDDGVTPKRFKQIYLNSINLVDRTTDADTPADGITLYMKNGELKFINSSGTIKTVTTI